MSASSRAGTENFAPPVPGPAQRAWEWAAASRATPFVVFLAFILLLSYEVLPWKGGILNYSDGAYLWPSGGFDFISTWNASNFGFPFIAQSFTSFQYLPSLLTEFLFHGLPAGDAYHAYVLYYGPVYACCLLAYFLGYRVSGNVMYGYFAGVFLIVNNFMLEQLLVWPVSYFYCLAGLLAQACILWIMYQEGVTRRRAAACVLVSLLAHHPFLFIIHISFQVLFLAYLCVQRRMRQGTALAIAGASVLMQTYWLLPFLYNLFTTTVAETHKASGDSAYWGYIYTITYSNLFNLLNYPLLLDERIFSHVHDNAQTLFNYALLAGITVLMMAAMARRSPWLKDILFFFCLYLFFFNLALGPNSQVTGLAWMWAYNNVPGFQFFRSFNRFTVAAIVALILLAGMLLRSVDFRHKTRVMLAVIVANLAAYPSYLSGTFDGMVGPSHPPAELYQANERYFRGGAQGVILSLPHIPYEAYAWSVNERNDLANPSMYFLSYFMAVPVILNQYAYMLHRQYPEYTDVLAFYADARRFEAEQHERIRKLGVRFVMVHKDRMDTLKKNDRIIPWGLIHDDFARNEAYVLREDNRHFSLFELNSPLPMVSGDGVEYRQVTQTKYEVTLRNLSGRIDLRFAQSFHAGWKLYPADMRESPHAADGPRKNRLFPGDIGLFVAAPAVDEAAHRKVDSFANSWSVDAGELRRRLPAGSYEVNSDGSINVRLLLYFRPQALLTLGILCSLVVVLACLLGLLMPAQPRPLRSREAAAPA